MESATVDISGIDKIELLRALHAHQQSAAFFSFSGVRQPPFDAQMAATAIADGYIGYFCGKAIKTDLSEDVVDSSLYDRDAPGGKGAFSKIVDELKKNKKNIM